MSRVVFERGSVDSCLVDFKRRGGPQKKRATEFRGGLSVGLAVGFVLFALSFYGVCPQAAAQSCTSYVVISAFDHKTGADIKNLNADDFEARLGKGKADIVSATEQFDDRLLVLLQTDGTRSEKIEDVVNLATRLVREAPEGKPVAFGVFVKRAAFTKGFAAESKQRSREISEIAEEEPSLGNQVHLYDALHQALQVFGPHQPGDTVLLISDGYDEGSDHSGSSVEKEFVAQGTRLIVMLRRTPSHVSGNFMWTSPERQIQLLKAMSTLTGGTYTMFSASDFKYAWQGYLVGVLLPEGHQRTGHKFQVQLQGVAAETYRRPNLYFPERLPPCSTAPSTTASR
jgi:hypothetical protein